MFYMSGFTQKYTVVHLVEELLPNGYEYSMKDWPVHITLADVFAIEGTWVDLLRDLESGLESQKKFLTEVVDNDLFGVDRSIKVKILKNNSELRELHENIVNTLERHNVIFNSPQYTRSGFKPHSTEQKQASLHMGDTIEFGSITLIDMYPDDNPYKRRILGTIHFS